MSEPQPEPEELHPRTSFPAASALTLEPNSDNISFSQNPGVETNSNDSQYVAGQHVSEDTSISAQQTDSQEEFATALDAENETKQVPAVHASSVESEEQQQAIDTRRHSEQSEVREELATTLESESEPQVKESTRRSASDGNQEELATALEAENETKQEPAVHASSVESEEQQQAVEQNERQEEFATALEAENEAKQDPAVHASSVESEEEQRAIESVDSSAAPSDEIHRVDVDEHTAEQAVPTSVSTSLNSQNTEQAHAFSAASVPGSVPPTSGSLPPSFSSMPMKPPPPPVQVDGEETRFVSILSPIPTKPPPRPVRLEGDINTSQQSILSPPSKPPPPPIHIEPARREVVDSDKQPESSSANNEENNGVVADSRRSSSQENEGDNTRITVETVSDDEEEGSNKQQQTRLQSPSKQPPFSALTVLVEDKGKKVSTPMSVASQQTDDDNKSTEEDTSVSSKERAPKKKRDSSSSSSSSSSEKRKSTSIPRRSSIPNNIRSSLSNKRDSSSAHATSLPYNDNDTNNALANGDEGGNNSEEDFERDVVEVKKSGRCGSALKRITIVHRLLWIVFCFLLAGVVLSTQLNQDTGRTGAVVGLIGWMASIIFLCLMDLKFEYVEPKDAAFSSPFRNLGFKQKKVCCNWNISLSALLNESVVSMMSGLIFAAGFISLYVRYGTYIKDEFWYFLVECALMSVLTAIPLVLLSWNRGGKSKELMMETGLISSKLGGLHILLELCGFYARHFEETERISIVGVDIARQNDTEIMRIIREQILEPIESSADGGHTLMLLLICFSTFTGVGIGLALLRRATCRDPKKQRSLEKLLAYGHLGARMKAMLLLNTFLCMIMIMVLNKGLRSNDNWSHEVRAFSNRASDWILYVMLAFIVWFIAMVSLGAVTTRYAGFIKASPWAFTAELGMVCLLTVTPLGYLAFNRGKDHAEMIKDLGVLTLAAAGVHVLLELSGAYSTELLGRYRKDDIQLLPRTVRTEREIAEAKAAETKVSLSPSSPTSDDDIPVKVVDETAGKRFAAIPCRCLFRLIMKIRRATPAHWVLVFVLICLAGGVFITFGISAAGPKTFVIVGLIGIVAFVIFVCLCDLRMTYLEPEEAQGKCDNVGFKTCRWLCVKDFSLQYFITLAMVSALGGFLVISGFLSIHVRYGGYIRADFWAFLVECVLMSVLTAVPVVLVSWNRGGQSKELLVEAGLISGKFGGLHIMLELSGFYAETFEQKMRYSIVGQDWSDKNSSTILKIVHEQILESEQEDLADSVTHESIFMILLLLFFLSSVVIIELAFARRFFCRDKKKARSAEKLHAFHALGARMKAMLVLSIIMLIIVIPIIVLGFRDHDDWEENIKPVSVIWTEVAMNGILLALGASVGLVSFAAATTRYGGFILVAPWSFVAELGLVCLLSVTPLGYVSFNRGHEHEEIELELGILTLKFGGLHLLLELSGFYATALGGRYHRDFITPLPRYNPDAGVLPEHDLPVESEALPQPTLKHDPVEDDYDAGPQEI